MSASRIKSAVRALVLLLPLLLGACANGAWPPGVSGIPDPSGQTGRIYFYRSAIPYFIALDPELVVNGRSVGRSRSGEFFFRDALPGRYEAFLATNREESISFNVAARSSVYIKTYLSIGFGAELALEVVDPAKARAEIATLRLVQGNVSAAR